MKITVKKLWHDCISIRDYVVNKAINDREAIEVYYDNKKMTLYPHDLRLQGKLTNVKSRSKFSGQEYSLIDFPWKPDVI